MSGEYGVIAEALNERVETLLGFSHASLPPYDKEFDALNINETFYWEPQETELGDISNSVTREIVQTFSLSLRYEVDSYAVASGNVMVSGIENCLTNLHDNRDTVISSLLTSPPSGINAVEWEESDWEYLNEKGSYILDESEFRVVYRISL